MRNNPQKITLCLDMFFRGVSLRKIQEHLKAFHPHNSSHEAIHNWVTKYPQMIGTLTDRLALHSGSEVQVDEMEYKTKGKESWFIDAIDTKTRFMTASLYAHSRGQDELKYVLKRTKIRTGENIKVVTTDGYTAYDEVVRRSFGYNLHAGKFNVYHNKRIASKGAGFNYKIERLHNTIRERTKIFRGFKNVTDANSIMKGYEIFYNFIRKHQAINCCPYELATTLKLTENNKWLELIHLAKENED